MQKLKIGLFLLSLVMGIGLQAQGIGYVRLTSGALVFNPAYDISTMQKANVIEYYRFYDSGNLYDGDLGTGWTANTESRIILGAYSDDDNYVQKLLDLYAENNFPEMYAKLDSCIKILEGFLAEGVPAAELAKDFEEIDLQLKEVQNFEKDILQEIKNGRDWEKQYYAQLSRNKYVLKPSDPQDGRETGNCYLGLVAENGVLYLYEIVEKPNYDSTVLYTDGSINYYPKGSTTRSTSLSAGDLRILADGSYLLTKSDNTQLFYSFYGQIQKIVSANNYTQYYVYVNHKLAYIKDSFNQRLVFERDADGHIVAIKGPSNINVTYQYRDGKLAIVKINNRVVTEFKYVDTNIVQANLPFGLVRYYTFQLINNRLRVVKLLSESKFTMEFEYDVERKSTYVKRSDNQNIRYFFNDDYLTIRQEYDDGSFSIFEYDQNDHLIKEVKSDGTITEYNNTSHGPASTIIQ